MIFLKILNLSADLHFLHLADDLLLELLIGLLEVEVSIEFELLSFRIGTGHSHAVQATKLVAAIEAAVELLLEAESTIPAESAHLQKIISATTPQFRLLNFHTRGCPHVRNSVSYQEKKSISL